MVVRNPRGRIRSGDARRGNTSGRIRQNDTPRAQVPPRNLARPCSDFSCFTRFCFLKIRKSDTRRARKSGCTFQNDTRRARKSGCTFQNDTARARKNGCTFQNDTGRANTRCSTLQNGTDRARFSGWVWGFDTWRLAHSSPTRFP